MNVSEISQLITDNILNGGRRTTAERARAVFNAINTSFLNIEDHLNVNGGYLGIDSSGKVDVSKIKKDTPTGQFLKDNGTWGYVINGTGLVRASGATISYDNSAYITLASTLTGYATAGSPSVITQFDSVLEAFGKLQAQSSNASSQISTINTTLTGVLHTTGAETKTGVLTFVNSPVVPTPSLATDAANKAYVDASVIGLLDDRGNYTPSGGNYPTSGGSGSSGVILKGDLWTIAGVSGTATVGTKTVTNGDVVRALQDSPSATNDAHWAIGENNLGYTALNASLTSGAIYVGNGSNIGAAVTMSGAITMTSAGVTSYNSVVPNNKGGTGTSSVFSPGSIVFVGASGIYTEDNARLYYDPTNHFLLLNGATYHNSILHVASDSIRHGVHIDGGTGASGVAGLIISYTSSSTAMPTSSAGYTPFVIINQSNTVGSKSGVRMGNYGLTNAVFGTVFTTVNDGDFYLGVRKSNAEIDYSTIYVKGLTSAVGIGNNLNAPTATLHLAGATASQSSLRLGVASALPTGTNRYAGDINFMSGRYYGYTANNTTQETFAFLSDLSTAYTETITTFTSAWGASTQTLANVRYLFYFVNPSDSTARTINLNATPTSGDLVVITDAKGDAGTYNITVNGNGKNINNDTAVIIDNDTQSISLKYNGTAWFLI